MIFALLIVSYFAAIDGFLKKYSFPNNFDGAHFMSSPEPPPAKGIGFNYDPSQFKDKNSGNYRRLTEQLERSKKEEESMTNSEKKELMLEKMKKQRDDVFRNTPLNTSYNVHDYLTLPPAVEAILAQLDEELIGLQSVKDSMRSYAQVFLIHKLRE